MVKRFYSFINFLKNAKNSILRKIGFSSRPSYLLPMKIIYSQYGQDYFVSNIIYKKKPGFFVDIGARCGKVISNTYHLEKNKWEGICIEPHPDLYEKLRRNRKCKTFNLAISNKANEHLDFVKFLQEPFGHSGLMSTFRNPQRLKYINHELISVKTIDLTTLLDEIKAPSYIEYLDIDVEGHEFLCLSGINFNKYKFGLIGIETTPKSNSYPKIKSLLQRNNYTPIAVIGSDTFFIED